MHQAEDGDQDSLFPGHLAAEHARQHQDVEDLDKLGGLEGEAGDRIGDHGPVGGDAQEQDPAQDSDPQDAEHDAQVPHAVKKFPEKRNDQHEQKARRSHDKLLDRLILLVAEAFVQVVGRDPGDDHKTDREQHADVVEQKHVRHLVHDPVQGHKGEQKEDLHPAQEKEIPLDIPAHKP